MEIVTLSIPAQHSNDPIEWAKKHCASFVTYGLNTELYCDEDGQLTIILDYHFSKKEDAIYFALTWSFK